MSRKFKIKKLTDQAELGDIYNQLIGGGSANVKITHPKYLRIRSLLFDDLAKLVKVLGSCTAITSYSIDDSTQLLDFYENVKKYEEKFQAVSYPETDEEKATFEKLYVGLKEISLVDIFLRSYDNLVPYKLKLNEKDFKKVILAMAGVDFSPFIFTKLNFKYLLAQNNIGDQTVSFILLIFTKYIQYCEELYKELMSPDIDIDEFVTIITSSIGNLRHHPELSRCTRAFKKLENSVHLLKNNFGGYYKDFLNTKQPTIIMEHFILDISNENDVDMKTLIQLKQIIKYYTKLSNNTPLNPQAKSLIDAISSYYAKIEAKMDNLKGRKPKVEEDDTDEDIEEIDCDLEDSGVESDNGEENSEQL